MLDTDWKIANFFFALGVILTLAAMVLGPLDFRSWSIAAGVTGGFVSLAGMYFAFQSWDAPAPVPPTEEQEPSTEESFLPKEQ